MTRRARTGSIALLSAVIVTGSALAAWKHSAVEEAAQTAASQPEPIETVAIAVAEKREHYRATTSIGTIARNALDHCTQRTAWNCT